MAQFFYMIVALIHILLILTLLLIHPFRLQALGMHQVYVVRLTHTSLEMVDAWIDYPSTVSGFCARDIASEITHAITDFVRNGQPVAVFRDHSVLFIIEDNGQRQFAMNGWSEAQLANGEVFRLSLTQFDTVRRMIGFGVLFRNCPEKPTQPFSVEVPFEPPYAAAPSP